MPLELWCLSLFAILGLLTGGGCLRLKLTTNSPYESGSDSVVLFTMGATVNLTCTLEDTEGRGSAADYLVAWYYNNIPRDTVENGVLLLNDASFADGGWYTCTVSTDTQRYELDFLVLVGEAPIVERGVPNGLSYEVQEGGRVEFSCFPRGVPQPNVTWYRGDPAEGDVILDGAEQGPYRIDPTSHSLVILNVNESLLKPTFTCEASNRFGKKTISYTAGLSNTYLGNLQTFSLNDTNLLRAVNQFTNSITLECHPEVVGSDSFEYSWFKDGDGDGVNLPQANLTLMRDVDGSGFYCCEIYNSSTGTKKIFNVNCTTVVFRSHPVFTEPTPPADTAYHIPRGRTVPLICRGITDVSPNLPIQLHYDPPVLNWTTSDASQTSLVNPSTELPGLAYGLVQGTSGSFKCSGRNSVGSLDRNIEVLFIDITDIAEESSHILTNGLAEEEGGWTPSGNASITTFRNEKLFMLSFSDSQSINNTWLSQKFVLSDEVAEFSIRGRIRQAQNSNNGMGAYPVIQVFGEDNGLVTELVHPVRDSMAWQWVKESVPTHGTTRYEIRLALKTDGNRTTRQTSRNGGTVFFDDIDITSTETRPTESDSGNEELYYIIGGSVGGAVLLAAIVIGTIIFYCCCCRKGKDNARPMRKITLLLKKRYTLSSKVKHNKAGSPMPVEYEIPLSAGQSTDGRNEYTSLNPHSLDEPSYYTSTHTTFDNSKKPGEQTGKEGEDVGGVNMYLEVVPSLSAHGSHSGSPRGGSPLRGTPRGQSPVGGSPRGRSPLELIGLADTREKSEESTELSPDVLDGDVVDPSYEYVNTDLGPM